jgi:uncharacterized protein (TIGR02117 family)
MPRARPGLGLAPLLLVLSYLGLAACGGASQGPRGHEPPAAATELVHVVSNGWHTGVVVSGTVLASARLAPDGHRYVEVGWGDRDAYLVDRITPRLALRAAFASRGSVLLITGFDEPIAERYRGIDAVELRVSSEGLAALARFIESSVVRDDVGRSVPLEAGWTPSSAFYLARGHFHLLNTCNAWTARALQAAGLPLRPALTLTAYHLMEQVVPLGRRVAASPA